MSEQGGNPNDLVLGAVPYEGARMGVFRGAAAGGAQFQYAQLVLGVISPPPDWGGCLVNTLGTACIAQVKTACRVKALLRGPRGF